MAQYHENVFLHTIASSSPSAAAAIQGDKEHASLKGWVYFYRFNSGTIVEAKINGLPSNQDPCANQFFSFHIHEGSDCNGTPDDPFKDSKLHYNPTDCPHPEHAGDMPPLLSNNGFAWCIFYTDHFNVDEIRGRTVIIHSQPDDFKTQPSGDSGSKIACGKIG